MTCSLMQIVMVQYEMRSGNNHVQNFHLARYIVGYTFGNLALWQKLAINMISKHISDDIPPK